MSFTIRAVADLYETKHNVLLSFESTPTLFGLVRAAEAQFNIKAEASRPTGFPDVPFKVETLQIFNDQGCWVDLVRDDQLRPGAQVWIFQHGAIEHEDAQEDMSPEAEQPAQWAPRAGSPQRQRQATDAECPPTLVEKMTAVFHEIDGQGKGYLLRQDIERAFDGAEIQFNPHHGPFALVGLSGSQYITWDEWQQFAIKNSSVLDALFSKLQGAPDYGAPPPLLYVSRQWGYPGTPVPYRPPAWGTYSHPASPSLADGGDDRWELGDALRRTTEKVQEMRRLLPSVPPPQRASPSADRTGISPVHGRSPLQPVLHVPSGLGGSSTFQGAGVDEAAQREAQDAFLQGLASVSEDEVPTVWRDDDKLSRSERDRRKMCRDAFLQGASRAPQTVSAADAAALRQQIDDLQEENQRLRAELAQIMGGSREAPGKQSATSAASTAALGWCQVTALRDLSASEQLARSPQSPARSPSAQERASPRSGGSRELLLVTADSSEADSSEAEQWRAACSSVIMQQLGYDLPTPEYLQKLQARYMEIQDKLLQINADDAEVEQYRQDLLELQPRLDQVRTAPHEQGWGQVQTPGRCLLPAPRSPSPPLPEAIPRHGTPPAPGSIPPGPGGHGTPPRSRPPAPGHLDAQPSLDPRSPLPRKQLPAAAEGCGVSLGCSGSAGRGSGAMGGGDLAAPAPGPQVTPQKPRLQPVAEPSAAATNPGGDYASDSAAWLTSSRPATPDPFSPGCAPGTPPQ